MSTTSIGWRWRPGWAARSSRSAGSTGCRADRRRAGAAGRGRVRGGRCPPGPRDRLGAAGTPGRDRPGARASTRFEALVLAENRTMMRVFLDAGFAAEPAARGQRGQPGVRHRRHRADPEGDGRTGAAGRLPLDPAGCCYPRSVAVIGASADPAKIGHLVLRQPAAVRFHRPDLPGQPARPLDQRRSWPTRASPTSRARSTWRCWPFRPPRSPRWSPSAAPAACTAWW